MAHGGYNKRKMPGRPSVARRTGSTAGGAGRGRSRVTSVRKDPDKKTKIVSIKNQIRSIERLLKKVWRSPQCRSRVGAATESCAGNLILASVRA